MGGLGRIITDDVQFSKSALGTKLLQLAEDFAEA